MDQKTLVQGAIAKVETEIATATPYATSGTPNLSALSLAEVALSETEIAAIVELVRKAIKTDEGNKALFEGAVGLVQSLLKQGLAFVAKV